MDVRMQFTLIFLLLALISSALGQTKKISGNCWQDKQCEGCQNSVVGRVNYLTVCCANCEDSGMSISSSDCTCLHNGSGKSMWKPGYPSGSGTIRGSSLCAYSGAALVAILLKFIQ